MSDRIRLKVIVVEAELPASQQLDLVEFIEELKRAESGIDAANKTLAAVTGRRVKKSKARQP